MRISDWSSDVCSSDLPTDLHDAGAMAIVVGGLYALGDAVEMIGLAIDRIDTLRGAHGAVQVIEVRQIGGVIALGIVGAKAGAGLGHLRSEEHKSELQSLMANSYAVFCLTKKIN